MRGKINAINYYKSFILHNGTEVDKEKSQKFKMLYDRNLKEKRWEMGQKTIQKAIMWSVHFKNEAKK